MHNAPIDGLTDLVMLHRPNHVAPWVYMPQIMVHLLRPVLGCGHRWWVS